MLKYYMKLIMQWAEKEVVRLLKKAAQLKSIYGENLAS